ncbi:hypothetical protein P691DRAFT_762570 [Macrolepiota fuliginosa MF-IS2]|uniref:G-protein coupled receptors family 3 profile domain-containing protein n=1 Tax=Macrolepiota fuliginosa MF-IS2 TaxID=1400762 RepID=A0A9P6C177_9AGAR|nr:hypothetical protein P691DRAFT_762570 [Macrolepiota fuliginosa MF-IS2]
MQLIAATGLALILLTSLQVGDPPDATLCVVQAALIYAAPTLTACTTLSLVIHMYLNFRALLYTSAFDVRPITALMLLGVPYLVWGVVFTGVLVFETQNPETVRRSPKGTYCDSHLPILSHLSSSVVVVATVVIVLLLGILAYRIIRNRRYMLREGTMFAMLFRVVAFSIFGIMALGVSVSFVVTNNHDGVFDMLLASLPLLAMLIFGSQMDLVRVWMCRRRGYIPAGKSDLAQDEFQELGSSDNTSPYR